MGLAYAASGQSGLSIRGVVNENKPDTVLSGANLVLTGGNKTGLKTVSNLKGQFSFQNVRPGKYLLITTYLSFKADTQNIRLNNDTTLIINLKRINMQLAEVKVKSAVVPVSAKGDTVVFNAEAYKTKPFATVDELLKMLPGIMIDKDGNVSMNGKKIDRILIDGKSFFIDDLRKATKIFPAEIISKIEIYDTKTEAADLAGIKTPGAETKTINLKIKEGKKNSSFGKLYAGEGNNNTYAAGGNFNRLDGSQMFSIQASSNNINNQFTGDENTNGNASGKQKLNVIGLNYRDQLSKKLSFSGYLDYNQSTTGKQSSSYRQTFLSDSSLISNSENNTANRQWSLKSGIGVVYKPDNHNSFIYDGSLETAHNLQTERNTTLMTINKPDTTYLSSSGLTDNTMQQNSNSFQNRVSFIHQFNKTGRALIVIFNQTSTKQNNPSVINTQVQTYVPSLNQIVNQRIINPVQSENGVARVTYAEPLGKKLNLGIDYGFNYADDRLIKVAENFDPATKLYDMSDTSSSVRFTTMQTQQQLKVNIGNKDQKFHYYLALGEEVANQDNDNLTDATHTNHTYYSLIPVVNVGWVVKNGTSMDITYQGYSHAPTIDQLQPLPDLSNPYLQKIGNPDLKQSYGHRIRSGYTVFNTAKATSLQFSLQADVTQNQIAGATTTMPGGVQQIQYVNLNGIYHLSTGAVYGFPLLSQENGTGSVQGDINYGHDKSIVNGAESTNQSEGFAGLFLFNYHHGKNLFIGLGGTFQFQANHFSAPAAVADNSLQLSGNFDVTYMLPFNIGLGGSYGLQYSKTGSLPVQQSNLLNAFISKGLVKDQTLQIRLSGFNLLDTASGISQNIGANYIETTKTNTPHRFILFSLVYNFIKAAGR